MSKNNKLNKNCTQHWDIYGNDVPNGGGVVVCEFNVWKSIWVRMDVRCDDKNIRS